MAHTPGHHEQGVCIDAVVTQVTRATGTLRVAANLIFVAPAQEVRPRSL